MNLQPVNPAPAFHSECRGCSSPLLVEPSGPSVWADLEGPAFRAYYCADCSARIRAGEVYPIPYAGICGTALVSIPGPFASLAEIEEANVRRGHFWFSRDTIRFFLARNHGKVKMGRFWITSRQFEDSKGIRNPREYAVVFALDDGSVNTVSFPVDRETTRDHFPSANEARAALRQLLSDLGVDGRTGRHEED
uniref:Uncharacterized protein n=1 Tax=viral metagenome TaxID=1070528 RepID=A0A6H2A3G6_9ZZZZ